MREILSHRPGKIFLVIVLGSWLLAHTAVQYLFEPDTMLFGWMTSPIIVGVALMIIWLVAFWIYIFKYWPYR